MLSRMRIIARVLGDERMRFVLVGAWNTVIGYLIFVAVHLLAEKKLHPIATLLVAYAISLPQAFLTQRLMVFRSEGDWRLQFLRFASANSVIFFSNLFFLPIATTASGAGPLLVQACFVVVSTLASYVVHRHFSFAR